MPQSLDGLRSAAKKLVKPGAKVKMYHRGETEVGQDKHLRNMQHEDVIIVTQEKANYEAPFRAQTTHQATYVQHPTIPEPRQEPKPAPASPMKPPAFLGRSCYASDYKELPIQVPNKKPTSPKPAWEPQTAKMQGRSTYNDNFPWHVPVQQEKTRPEKAKYQVNPAPFHGKSSYKSDYIERELERPQTARDEKERRMKKHSPDAANTRFDATTTYALDFKDYPMSPAVTASPKKYRMEPGVSPKFQGNSEYKTEYLEREMAKTNRIHLMPHIEDTRGSRS